MFLQYRDNLTHFVNNLEKSGIQLVDFSVSKGVLEASEVHTMGRWDRNDGLCYVSLGWRPGWCYVYMWGDIGGFTEVNETSGIIGNHFTFGLLESTSHKVFLKTQFTRYRNISDMVNEYDRLETSCYLCLEGGKEEVVPLDRVCEGDEDGDTLGKRFTAEKSSVVQDMSRVYYGAYSMNEGGKKICNEVGDLSDLGFIQFLTKYVLNPVLAVRKDMIGARMLYDKRDELGRGSHKNIVILYDFRDLGMHLYFIDAGKAFTAYRVYLEGVDKVSTADKKCFEEFVGMVKDVLVAGETVVG